MSITSRTTPAQTGRTSDAGFSLIELIVALAVTMTIMAGTFAAMSQAMKTHETGKLVTGMNSNLRTAMDMLVRDLVQAGQGLPTSKRIEVPNGLGAVAINRPGPVAMTFPVAASLPAVSWGADLGPTINSHATDMITVLMADPMLTNIPIAAIPNQNNIIVADAAFTGGLDITVGGIDDVRAGDLIMLQRGGDTTMMQVTAVANNTITCAANDSLRLNQFDPVDANPLTEEMAGTINQLLAISPAEPTARVVGTVAATTLMRIVMVTYYMNTANPAKPQLMRRVNNRAANAVGFDFDDFKLTYDLTAPGIAPPPNALRMVATDLVANGPCGEDPCSENAIRKVNIVLAGRSRKPSTVSKTFFRNTLFSQVSTRNLSFIDRYRS